MCFRVRSLVALRMKYLIRKYIIVAVPGSPMVISLMMWGPLVVL